MPDTDTQVMPWQKYQAQPKPWERYSSQKSAPVSVADQPLNENNVYQPGVDTQPLYPLQEKDVTQPTTRTQRLISNIQQPFEKVIGNETLPQRVIGKTLDLP